MLFAPLLVLATSAYGDNPSHHDIWDEPGYVEQAPKSYGTWVIGDHGGHYMRNPDGCMPRTDGMPGHCAEKSGSGPICHDGANRVVGCDQV